MRSNVILQTYYFIVQKHYINSHETAKIYRVYTKVNAVAVLFYTIYIYFKIQYPFYLEEFPSCILKVFAYTTFIRYL